MKSTDVASVTEPSWRSIDPSNSSSFSEPSGSSSEVEVSFAESTNASSGGRERRSRVVALVPDSSDVFFDESSLARASVAVRRRSVERHATLSSVTGTIGVPREKRVVCRVCVPFKAEAHESFADAFAAKDSFLIASSLASSTVSSRGGLFESGDPAWAES